MSYTVKFSKKAEKSIRKAPKQVQQKMALWKVIVESKGLLAARVIKGFHDKPLHGHRSSERSIRLNLQWRAIYKTSSEGKVMLIEVIEVTPHKY